MFKLFNWNGNVETDINYIYKRLDELEKRIDGFYVPYNDLFSKVNSLYKKDFHGFSRPKVDILEDNTNDVEMAVWESMAKLQKRIEGLEGKK